LFVRLEGLPSGDFLAFAVRIVDNLDTAKNINLGTTETLVNFVLAG